MIDYLELLLLASPALIGLMFGAFWYPYMKGKKKFRRRLSLEAGIVGGLISFIGFFSFAIFDFDFLPISFAGEFLRTIGLSIFMMFGTGLVALLSLDKESTS